MATLQPFLSRISTHDGRVLAAEALMNHVYGHHKHSQWQPRPLAENRSRYLWTDAFGICNYISLACEKDRIDYLVAADKLIASVLNTLGRHRGSSVRLGKATQRHPTLGGLRIGKMHPEGHPDGDGQYYHYLTKMAFALNRMSIITKQHHYNDWAIELLSSVHPHFVTPNKKMFWKLTVDMKHPLVLSEGNLDPYDGFITTQYVVVIWYSSTFYHQSTMSIFLNLHSRLLQAASTNPTTTLVSESSDFQSMVKCKYKSYSSSDPLDLGEALWLCHWALVTPSSTLARLSGNDCMEIWGHEISVRSLAALDSLWKVCCCSGYIF